MSGVRRSGRIAKEVRILLLGTDTSGHIFSEETNTVVLSRHGAGIVSRHKLAADEVLTLRLFGTSAEAGVRLVGQIGQETRGYTYGVEFADPDMDFWEMKFPAPPDWHNDSDGALECTACHNRQIVHQSEVEADVYALLKSILRFCPQCGTSTAWRQAVADDLTPIEVSLLSASLPSVSPALASQLVPAPASSPLASPLVTNSYSSGAALTVAEKETEVQVAVPGAVQPIVLSQVLTPASLGGSANRRQALRSRVNFTARVRQTDGGDETVECDNISKAGLSFRSLKSYPVGSAIEVAVPYSPGWDAVFVSAHIKHVEELPGGTLFRYGAAYTKPAKRPRDA
jgi:hypothetical protein